MLSNTAFKSQSLRRQLLLWLLIPLSLLWLVNAVVAYRLALHSANSAYDRSLHDATLALVDQLSVNQGHVEVSLPQVALEMLEADEKDRIYYRITGPRGEFVFGHASLPMPPSKVSNTPLYYESNYLGARVRVVALSVPLPGMTGQFALIQVAETLVKRHELVEEWLLNMVLPQLLLIVLAAVTVWYGVGRGLRPLVQLHDEITLRAAFDLSPLPEQKVSSEIQPLVQAINEMMLRVGNLLEVQQRFVADAAHQLRTPLAGLKAQLELAQRLDDPVQLRHALQQMHTATEQAAHLVQQLLVLARAEPDAQHSADLAVLDWHDLAQKITRDWVQAALQKNIDLGFESDEQPCLRAGNALLLGEMLNNLIDNALRYTPSGGQVTVRVFREPAQLLIEVEDNGIGIFEAQRERVFERFYRVLGSAQSGCGLGLAIVREIATRHGGTVSIQDAVGEQGSCVRLIFPA
jgi:two-component system sensor histidine kinase TctE